MNFALWDDYSCQSEKFLITKDNLRRLGYGEAVNDSFIRIPFNETH